MKIRGLIGVIYISVFFPLGGFAENVIRISTGEEPPYSSQTLPQKGCALTFIEDAYKLKGFNVEYTFLPWRRAYVEAKQGLFDATAYWLENKERVTDFIQPKQHVTAERIYFYKSHNDKKVYTTYDDLFKSSIVVNIGYTYNKEFWQEIDKQQLETIRVPHGYQNFKMLLSGRAKITVMSESPAQVYLNSMPLSDSSRITKTRIPPIVTKGYLLISRKNTNGVAIANAFDEGAKLLMSDKNYRNTFEKKCGSTSFQ